MGLSPTKARAGTAAQQPPVCAPAASFCFCIMNKLLMVVGDILIRFFFSFRKDEFFKLNLDEPFCFFVQQHCWQRSAGCSL